MSGVDPHDAEKVYGALSHYKITAEEGEEPEPMTPEELNPPFAWEEYLVECLDHLVEVYDGVEKRDDGYLIVELEQEKHNSRTRSVQNNE